MDLINNAEWKGYTLDDIKMRRMVTLTRIEIEKAKLMHTMKPLTDKKEMMASMPILRKLTGALSYVDYAVIAFQLVKNVSKIFHRRR